MILELGDFVHATPGHRYVKDEDKKGKGMSSLKSNSAVIHAQLSHEYQKGRGNGFHRWKPEGGLSRGHSR